MQPYGTWISFLIFLLFAAPAQAEEHVDEPGRFAFGGVLGLNLATLGGQDADTFSKSVNRVGPVAGGFASVKLHDWIAVQLELLYSSKGTGRERDGMDVGPLVSTYIDVPLVIHAGIPLHKRIKPYALVGARLSVLLGARVEYTDGTTVDVKDITTPVDYGLLFGAGTGIELLPKGSLQFEVRYDWGLNTLDDPQVDRERYDTKNRVLAFMLGFQYRL
jgi:opacity protein-like surface antigen